MSEEEPNNMDEIQKELNFYKNQTKVLREKNRDLRNALLLAESKGGLVSEEQETTQESISDIRKIIADSKKQITEKLSQFKETIHDTDLPSNTQEKLAPSAPQFNTSIDETSNVKPSTIASTTINSVEDEVLKRQVEYLKEEIDRLEIFLEQSEMVNNRLRDLLTEHSIDVSEISKAISEVSKSAISEKGIKQSVASDSIEQVKEPIKQKIEPLTTIPPKPAVVQKMESDEKKLDPKVAKLFEAFREKLSRNPNTEEIKLEILNFREQLMDLIPHSRVFYEMQVEYRKWKKDSSSIISLKDTLNEWEKTLASML
ncbi:MAG: hypothetical protein JXA54_07100 [Candidatus Heimdallarchaeota archaeon]|nr:hypothetical protein [Candidatus Heimdallarchaeota archaeon]